jgi:hypothetical protein
VVRAFDGSAVRAAKLNSAAGEMIETTLASGPTAAMKRDHLAEIEIRNGRIKYASDLPFEKVETQPFLDAAAPPRRDRNALGDSLRIDGAPVAKGIGMRSRGRISFAAAGFKRFEAKVALDDAAGSQGSVRFTVQADDKTVFDSGEMKPGDPPKDVRVELTRVRALVLAVEYAKRGDVDDLADWGDARFVE